MQETIRTKLAHAWNVFRNKEPTTGYNHGGHTSLRPDRLYTYKTGEKSIVSSIYNRIAIDVSTLDFRHIRQDVNGQYESTIPGSLNDLFSLEANIDQTGREFIQDCIHSMCDEGVVALVPIDTSVSPNEHGSFDIFSARVGRITEWNPEIIRTEVYNRQTGTYEEVMVNKKTTVIVQNPLSAIMNEPNSILRRLITKLNLLDVTEERSSSGKLDLIIQLPYAVKSTIKKDQAEKRKQDIEDQMAGSKYGIAYIDSAEKITQLNRPVDNDLVSQVEYLTNMLYNQLGLTEGIFNGTADEAELLNYFNRTIEPFANVIVDEVKRKWLTKTARTQGQSVDFFRDVFKLIPISELAEIADKLTRNEILSSNEFRGVIGYRPRQEKRADQLLNKNLNTKDQDITDEDDEFKIEEEVKKRLVKIEKDKKKKEDTKR